MKKVLSWFKSHKKSATKPMLIDDHEAWLRFLEQELD